MSEGCAWLSLRRSALCGISIVYNGTLISSAISRAATNSPTTHGGQQEREEREERESMRAYPQEGAGGGGRYCKAQSRGCAAPLPRPSPRHRAPATIPPVALHLVAYSVHLSARLVDPRRRRGGTIREERGAPSVHCRARQRWHVDEWQRHTEPPPWHHGYQDGACPADRSSTPSPHSSLAESVAYIDHIIIVTIKCGGSLCR